MRPGIRSCLPARFGTQKLWITSFECSSNAHRPPDRKVELVRRGEPCSAPRESWYWTSHHHWWPVTRIVQRVFVGSRASERPADALTIVDQTSRTGSAAVERRRRCSPRMRQRAFRVRGVVLLGAAAPRRRNADSEQRQHDQDEHHGDEHENIASPQPIHQPRSADCWRFSAE